METLWSPRYSHPNCLLGFRQSNNCADSEVDHHEKLLTIILLLSGAFLYCQPAIGTCIYPIVARLYIILRHMFIVYYHRWEVRLLAELVTSPRRAVWAQWWVLRELPQSDGVTNVDRSGMMNWPGWLRSGQISVWMWTTRTTTSGETPSSIMTPTLTGRLVRGSLYTDIANGHYSRYPSNYIFRQSWDNILQGGGSRCTLFSLYFPAKTIWHQKNSWHLLIRISIIIFPQTSSATGRESARTLPGTLRRASRESSTPPSWWVTGSDRSGSGTLKEWSNLGECV